MWVNMVNILRVNRVGNFITAIWMSATRPILPALSQSVILSVSKNLSEVPSCQIQLLPYIAGRHMFLGRGDQLKRLHTLIFSILLASTRIAVSCDEEKTPVGVEEKIAANTPTSPQPANDTTEVFLRTRLSWGLLDRSANSVLFDVYFGTEDPPPLVQDNRKINHLYTQKLQSGVTYYLESCDCFG